MRTLLLTTAAALIASGAAAADPSVDIRHAAVRVTVVPEVRSDVQVTQVTANARLPLHLDRVGDQVVIDGDLGHRPANCNAAFGRRSVFIWGVGRIPYEQLPQIVVRVPLDAKVGAQGAVYGTVGRGHGLELSNAGCGDWTVADQQGPLRIHNAGSGDVHAGSAQSVDIASSGSSDVTLKGVRNGLTTSISGSGDVTAAWVNGPLHAHIGGSGDVRVHDGQVSDMEVAVAGSGAVHFGGVAASLQANVAGSGDVSAARVTGPVVKHIAGSGDVTVGR
jgi:hypothetical protein